MASKTFVKSKTTAKRFFKFLAVCKDPTLFKLLLNKAPDVVIKLICNAALNASRGSVHLTSAQKKLFSKHKKIFSSLISRQISLKSKRKILNQRGGAFPLIPILLTTVLSSLGSLLFNK